MPRFLRKVKLKVWLATQEKPEWLGEEAIPADPVCSFRTSENTMSIFLVDNDDRTVEQIAAAFFTNPDSQIDNFE